MLADADSGIGEGSCTSNHNEYLELSEVDDVFGLSCERRHTTYSPVEKYVQSGDKNDSRTESTCTQTDRSITAPVAIRQDCRNGRRRAHTMPYLYSTSEPSHSNVQLTDYERCLRCKRQMKDECLHCLQTDVNWTLGASTAAKGESSSLPDVVPKMCYGSVPSSGITGMRSSKSQQDIGRELRYISDEFNDHFVQRRRAASLSCPSVPVNVNLRSYWSRLRLYVFSPKFQNMDPPGNT